MNFDDLQARIDSIALDFENDWSINRSSDSLSRCYAILPCDELLTYLVSADCELALRHGVVRNADYYLSIFPDQIAIIRLALSQSDASEFGERTLSHDDSFIDAVSQFFPILPYQFGKYRVTKFIGQGGMAAVFEAEVDNQKVALKIPYCQSRNLRRLVERFQKEIRLLSQLKHPHIVPVIEHGEIDGLSYFTMPLIDGQGLDENCTLERFEALSPIQSAAYMLQATQAIEYSHAVGILHRDIKPSNILVDLREHVWLVDFGLATVSDTNHQTLSDGKLLGTPTWMPPEQACGNHSQVDERSDVYSLGATLYTLLTGRTPFSGATTEKLLHNIQYQELTPPRHLCRRVPKSLQTIVMTCMEKDPKQRYRTASDLADDLTAFLQDRPIQAREKSIPVRTYRWLRLYPRRAFAGVGVLATLVVFSIAILVLRHVADLQRQIAANAELRREAAEKAEWEQKQLRILADKERARAVDAANYARAQQMRSAFSQAESSLQLRQYEPPAQLFEASNRQSIDSEWYQRQLTLKPRKVREFCMGDWGLYDVAVNPEKSLVATIGREGDIGVWNFHEGSLIKFCNYAERDPISGSAYNRWRYQNKLMDDFIPKTQPKFFSSLAWTQSGDLLLAGLNGELIEYSLESSSSKVVFTSATPLHWVRSNSDQSQFLTVDENGGCTALDTGRAVIAQAALGIHPTWMGFAAGFDAWIVASDLGELIFLDHGLREIGRLSTGSRIQDVDFVFKDSWHLLITSEGKSPQLYVVDQTETLITAKLTKEFVHQGNLPSRAFVQTNFDPRTNQFIAVDDNGLLAIWNLNNQRSSSFNNLISNRDVRRPRLDDLRASDLLERRPRYFLLEGQKGIVTVDCSGTLREFNLADLSQAPNWTELSIKVGTDARIAADPRFPDRFWALDKAGVLRYVSLSRNQLLAEHVGAHSGGYADLQVRSNGDVYTAGNDTELRVWQFHDGVIKPKTAFRHAVPLLSVALSKNDDLVATVDSEAQVLLFDLKTGKIQSRFPDRSSDRSLPIHSGRLAFSPSSKYLTAFGRGQDCNCIDIERQSLCPTSTINIAAKGGECIVFSPTVEHRFLTSSNAIGANEIETVESIVSADLLPIGSNIPAVDLKTTNNGQRVAALLSDGRILFYSPDHFVQLSELVCPIENPSSLAIGSGDSSLIVAAKDGSVSYCSLAMHPLNLQYDKTIDCTAQLVRGFESLDYLRASDLARLRPVQDNFGHLTELFTAGGTSAKSQLSRLHLLKKENGVWQIKRLRFDGDQDGPCECASLYRTPQDDLIAIIRQGQLSIGDYAGRLLIAHESPETWKTEVLQEASNAGFYPYPVFASDGSLESVLHFDHDWLRLLAHHRQIESKKWRQETIRGFFGFKGSGVRDSLGVTHMISRHSRGFDVQPPHDYFQVGPSLPYRFEKAKGEHLIANKNADIFSYEAESGVFWRKSPNTGWEAFDQVPFKHLPSYPTLDQNNQIWFAGCTGSHLLVGTRDMSDLKGKTKMPWRVFRLNLDNQFAQSASCVCNINRNGVLEILLCQLGNAAKLGIVETNVAEL